jgi:hypothetical protein
MGYDITDDIILTARAARQGFDEIIKTLKERKPLDSQKLETACHCATLAEWLRSEWRRLS